MISMKAWVVDEPGPIDTHPLQLVERAVPEPGPHEVRVRVAACGVCRTDLHLAEGDLAPKHARTVPGHEAVGIVEVNGVVQPAPAPRFSRTPASVQRPGPKPGQHTDEALADWGFSTDDIAKLRNANAIA